MAVSVNNQSLLPEIERMKRARDAYQQAAGARRHRRARARRRVLCLTATGTEATGVVLWKVLPMSPKRRREQYADWMNFCAQRPRPTDLSWDEVPESRSWDEPDDTDEDHLPSGRYYAGPRLDTPDDDLDLPF